MVGGKEAKWRKRKKIVLLLLILLSLATALSVIARKRIEFVEYIMWNDIIELAQDPKCGL